MTPETLPSIPQPYAERFAKAFAAFVDAVRSAVAEGALDPALSSSSRFLSWQTRALPLLERENDSIQHAFALYLIGEASAILAMASDKRHLAKDLDGFPLTFAGPDRAPALEKLLTAVVTTAYQLCAAAGIP
jgi:hypothetical protein